MKKTALTTLFTLLSLIAPTCSFAHNYKLGDIDIGHVWAYATVASTTTAAVYIPLENHGTQSDALVGVATEIAEKAQFDTIVKEGDVKKMRLLPSIPLPAKEKADLKPGGMHVMLFGLKQQLKAGDMLPLTLRFEKAGTIDVKIKIEPMGSMSEPDHSHM